MSKHTEAMKLACKALRDCHYYMINAGLPNQSLLNEAFTAYMELEAALAKQPAQQEPVQQGILARKWILHYGKESVAKFQKWQLSEPRKGNNCGSLNGWLHSAECRAEHEAHYTAPQPAQQEPTDSMGMPVSCGKPLCSPGDHHPLCKLAEQPAQQEPVAWFELLREARDNCKASIVEEGISASRKEYRIDLEARLTAALNTSPPAQRKPPSGWIAVSDRIPLESDGEVLLRMRDGRCEIAWATYWHGASNAFAQWTFRDPDEDEAPTHWMLIPAIEAAHGIKENT